QEEIDVGAAGGLRARDLVAEGALDVGGGVEHVDVGRAVQARHVAGGGGDVDDTAGDAAVAHAEAARVEVDAVDEARGQDRGPAEEVIEDGDAVAAHVDPRVLGRGPADDELAEAVGDARDAGEVLDDAQGIAEGAGDGGQLF